MPFWISYHHPIHHHSNLLKPEIRSLVPSLFSNHLLLLSLFSFLLNLMIPDLKMLAEIVWDSSHWTTFLLFLQCLWNSWNPILHFASNRNEIMNWVSFLIVKKGCPILLISLELTRVRKFQRKQRNQRKRQRRILMLLFLDICVIWWVKVIHLQILCLKRRRVWFCCFCWFFRDCDIERTSSEMVL